MAAPVRFRESNLYAAPIRDLGLSIEGTPLEPVLARFEQELRDRGISRLVPRFHLSTEWGVPFGTIVIGIPFYLARPELTELHAEEIGHIEGIGSADILRYLRHEMGHVVNYAYKLYEDEEWVRLFGSITQPYVEDYRPQPFSRRFVRHLPGWYAQKHPDEDWAETFAVWLEGRNWREEYSQWSTALAKLEYCDRTMARCAELPPVITDAELDQDVAQLGYSLRDFYREQPPVREDAAGLDGSLRALFEDLRPDPPADGLRPAAELIRRLERPLIAHVFRWTGHFPERTRVLVRQLAQRAEALAQGYPPERETDAILGVTVLVTSLAMNHVHRGTYFPEPASRSDA
jgi:hypothetical protein